MELVKKNIHTERIKAKALLQIPLEEDINVSDSRPDVGKPVFTRGKIKVDEVKSGTNKVWVKGRLVYQILYLAEGKESGLAGMEGELPFMEEIYMDMVESTDRAICNTNLEDMRVNLINSRKLSIQAVISLMPRVEENTQEEVCVDLNGAEKEQAKGGKELEYRKKPLDYLETAVSKRDLFRIHEENKLPAGLPAVGTVIWRSTAIQHVNFKPLSGKIAVGGELSLFLIYKEDISGRTNWYETTMPFSGNIECQGCEEMMTADIAYEVGHTGSSGTTSERNVLFRYILKWRMESGWSARSEESGSSGNRTMKRCAGDFWRTRQIFRKKSFWTHRLRCGL